MYLRSVKCNILAKTEVTNLSENVYKVGWKFSIRKDCTSGVLMVFQCRYKANFILPHSLNNKQFL